MIIFLVFLVQTVPSFCLGGFVQRETEEKKPHDIQKPPIFHSPHSYSFSLPDSYDSISLQKGNKTGTTYFGVFSPLTPVTEADLDRAQFIAILPLLYAFSPVTSKQ